MKPLPLENFPEPTLTFLSQAPPRCHSPLVSDSPRRLCLSRVPVAPSSVAHTGASAGAEGPLPESPAPLRPRARARPEELTKARQRGLGGGRTCGLRASRGSVSVSVSVSAPPPHRAGICAHGHGARSALTVLPAGSLATRSVPGLRALGAQRRTGRQRSPLSQGRRKERSGSKCFARKEGPGPGPGERSGKATFDRTRGEHINSCEAGS